MAPDITDLQYSNLRYDGWRQAQKTITFNGAVSGAIGDFNVGTPFDIFTVTGDVIAKVIGVCTTSVSGSSATVSVGVTGTVSGVINTTTADDIDVSEIWHDASPDTGLELSSVISEKVIVNGLDIIGTVATANVSSGVVRFDCLWKPLSDDGIVASA